MALAVFNDMDCKADGSSLQPLAAHVPDLSKLLGSQPPDDFFVPVQRLIDGGKPRRGAAARFMFAGQRVHLPPA